MSRPLSQSVIRLVLPSARASRILAGALAALVLLANLATVHHFAVVEHEVCATHQELHHGGDGHADQGRPGAPSDASDHDSPPRDEDHHHCPMATLARTSAVVVAEAPCLIEPLAQQPWPAVTGRVAPLASAPQYRLAPKQSPPVGV